MKTTAIIYGTNGGNTKTVAKKIAARIQGASLLDVSAIGIAELEGFDNLILGTSTWGMGDLQDDWEAFLPQLKKANLDGKNVALFGLGDSSAYPDTFVDGMGILYEALLNKPCRLIGSVQAEGYTFESSRAFDGAMFAGLPLDEDNEYDKTDERVRLWVDDLLQYL